MSKRTVKIRIWGIVQGVGFRPYVAKLADSMDIKGQILNLGGLVQIIITDTEERVLEFINALKESKPEPAEIVHVDMEDIPYEDFSEFEIVKSHEGGEEISMIPTDLAICFDCQNELFDEENPRYKHPFISCMICGPRYTIIDKVPYDRENTSMVDFPMCDFCAREYEDRESRRYHAQTISCHNCGPMLEYKLNKARFQAHDKPSEDPLLKASELLSAGEIIALKGVGGYNLLCDPKNESAIKNLRELKGREEKPFAVMFKSINELKEYCQITDEEEKLLTSRARPIVIVKRISESLSQETYKSSRYVGAFLPSIGVQYLLLEYISPLIVTSANLSDQMIIIDDDIMIEFMSNKSLLSAIFYNRRKINIPLDDSVVRVIDNQPQMIRRAKGYTPLPLHIDSENGHDEIYATGGQLKSAFSISKGSYLFISQCFGDLDNIETEEVYLDNFISLKKLLNIEPKIIVYDMHPLYSTTRIAEEIEFYLNDLLRVQHHHAHIASVMAEHNLRETIIGVAFDGTGYGDDGNIWGGEFLVCKGGKYERALHLEYIKLLGGDSSVKEGWKSALSYVFHYENNPKSHEENKIVNEVTIDISEIIKYSKIKEREEWVLVKAALENNVNVISSSSMGRLFDAVASLLDIHHVNRYEGECAIMLENAAEEALERPGVSKKNDLALSFHVKAANMILNGCFKIQREYKKKKTGELYNQVALSGGVFQNKILMELTLNLLRENGFKVYYNISVPPNDGGIALGQNYIALFEKFSFPVD